MSKQQKIMNIDLSPVLKEYFISYLPSNNYLLDYVNDLSKLSYEHFYIFSNSVIKLNEEIFDKPGFKSTYLNLDKNNKYYLSTVVAPIPVKFVKQLKDNRLGEFIVYNN